MSDLNFFCFSSFQISLHYLFTVASALEGGGRGLESMACHATKVKFLFYQKLFLTFLLYQKICPKNGFLVTYKNQAVFFCNYSVNRVRNALKVFIKWVLRIKFKFDMKEIPSKSNRKARYYYFQLKLNKIWVLNNFCLQFFKFKLYPATKSW